MISVVIVSKDEAGLANTLRLVGTQVVSLPEACEIVVVDASAGRLAGVRSSFPQVRWFDFAPPAGVKVSIPHQRNLGVAEARGDIIVFIDAACIPRDGWLEYLVAAIRVDGEEVAAGSSVAPEGSSAYYEAAERSLLRHSYLDEAPTLNLAFARSAFDAVGGFDESFQYGSDIDFTWRLVEAGFRIRVVPQAVVEHDWGQARRQLKRAYRYGRARARLYGKHRSRLRTVPTRDPMVVVYPLFILLLPLTIRYRAYPILLLVPAWRARHDGAVMVVADHLAYGFGILSALTVSGQGQPPVSSPS